MIEDEEKKMEDKIKEEMKKSKEREKILREEEKKKQDRIAKIEMKRKQAIDNKNKTMKELDKENFRKQRSMNQDYEKYLKEKRQREK